MALRNVRKKGISKRNDLLLLLRQWLRFFRKKMHFFGEVVETNSFQLCALSMNVVAACASW